VTVSIIIDASFICLLSVLLVERSYANVNPNGAGHF